MKHYQTFPSLCVKQSDLQPNLRLGSSPELVLSQCPPLYLQVILSVLFTLSFMQEQLVALKEMFPLENEQLLCDLLLQSNGSIDDAIEKLFSKQPDSSPSDAAHLSPLPSLGNCAAGPSSSSTLQITDNFAADHDMPSEQLFSSHAHHVLQLQSSHFCKLRVHRDRIWLTALGFYKNSLHNRQQLQYEF